MGLPYFLPQQEDIYTCLVVKAPMDVNFTLLKYTIMVISSEILSLAKIHLGKLEPMI